MATVWLANTASLLLPVSNLTNLLALRTLDLHPAGYAARALAPAAANLVNNLPAYLALEPAAGDSVPRLLAVLVGVNAGPLVLGWGSLATLLWRERCRARGLEVTARSFAASGLELAPVVLVASVAALALVGGGGGGGVMASLVR